MKLIGKTALVTGASSGIGRAQALALAAEGAQVVAVGTNSERLNAVVSTIQDNGADAIGYIADVSLSSDVEKMVGLALNRYGKIDILCNTAGIMDYYATILDVSEDQFDRIFAVNMKGIFLVTKAILPQMINMGHGVIINMSSIAGLTGGGGGDTYVASKHAVTGYTKQLCIEFAGKGIRINAIAPGTVATEMHRERMQKDPYFLPDRMAVIPTQRLGAAEDSAKLTIFLASDDSDYINGATISVDGGRLAHGGFFNLKH